MTNHTATTANNLNHAIGPDITLADAYDADYLDTDEVEDVDVMTREQVQALNARMAEWFNG